MMFDHARPFSFLGHRRALPSARPAKPEHCGFAFVVLHGLRPASFTSSVPERGPTFPFGAPAPNVPCSRKVLVDLDLERQAAERERADDPRRQLVRGHPATHEIVPRACEIDVAANR
jgi:hypothetical protein